MVVMSISFYLAVQLQAKQPTFNSAVLCKAAQRVRLDVFGYLCLTTVSTYCRFARIYLPPSRLRGIYIDII